LCPYLHESRFNDEASLKDQNIKDRFHGKNDPVAKKILKKILKEDVESINVD